VKIISESFYPQDGGESQLASKLRHCHPIFSHIRKLDIPGCDIHPAYCFFVFFIFFSYISITVPYDNHGRAE